jgi:aminoglycoside phosphotransferase (APT) family kinase protein
MDAGEPDAHRALLDRLLPGDPPGRRTVRRGQFHTVVLGAERVVCLPRTAAAAARLPQRAAVLEALAAAGIGVRAPVPLERGFGGATPFLVLDRVPGAPLPDGPPAAPAAAAAGYIGLLEALAAAGAAPALRAALPRDPADRWARFAAGVRDGLAPLMSPAGRRRADRELEAVAALPHRTDALVHGDLGAENVLWTADGDRGRVSGVVDWDGACLGDPAEDAAAVAVGHGPDLAERVLSARARTDPGLPARAAAIRGTFALQQALAALRDGDAAELADGLAGYR